MKLYFICILMIITLEFVNAGPVGSKTASIKVIPDSKVHGANMGPTWVLSAPGGSHVGPINLVIRDGLLSVMTVHWWMPAWWSLSGLAYRPTHGYLKPYCEDVDIKKMKLHCMSSYNRFTLRRQPINSCRVMYICLYHVSLSHVIMKCLSFLENTPNMHPYHILLGGM